jgi:hypothetical protein
MPSIRFNLLLTCIAATFVEQSLRAAEPKFHLSVTVSRDADRGENWGSLFEISDPSGKPIAGAGYLGAYNTFPRSDRDELHVFVRSQDSKADWQIECLPRVESTATGFYPFQVAGELYVSTRNGSDPQVHRWDDSTNSWQVAEGIPNGSEFIAGKNLHVATDRITWGGQVILKPDDAYRFGEHYFAEGRLILRAFRSDGQEPANTFRVFSWNPNDARGLQPLANLTLNLPQPREFVYTFGQWRDHILAITNMGGVYRLRPTGWDTLRTPDPAVSFQIYCGLNYRDKLLLGQYPTGEIYEYAGDQLVLNKDWPPVMRGVSRNAREAQTLAIYNGELYVGVWPWGEIWRYDGSDWHFIQRTFTHPATTDAITHPYEAETKQTDTVYNLWGQRVTGLVPYRGSLFITTSSKGGAPWESKFAFLTNEQWRDYGAIYRAKLPGQLSVHAPITSTSTRIEMKSEGEFLSIRLNGAEAGRIALATESLNRLAAGTIHWATGIYGPCRLIIESKTLETNR